MDAEILKTVGQISGIGGLSVGICLILFKEIIRKNIFPSLKKDHAYSLLKLITILAWSIALVGLLGWIFLEYLSKTIPSNILADSQSTQVNNSPVVHDTKGNVIINYGNAQKSGVRHFKTDIHTLKDSKKLKKFIILNKDSLIELDFYIGVSMMNIQPTKDYLIILNDMENYLGDCTEIKFTIIAREYVEAVYLAQKYARDGNNTKFSETIKSAAMDFYKATGLDYDMGIDEGEYLCSDVYVFLGEKDNYYLTYEDGAYRLKGFFIVVKAFVDEYSLNFIGTLKSVDQADVVLRR